MDIRQLLANLAEIDEMEAQDGMNIAEDLLDQNIIKASANLGVQDMIDMLLKIVGSYVSEKTLKTIKDQFTLALASEKTEKVNETEIQPGSLDDIEVRLNNIMNGGIVCRGNTYNMAGISQDKEVDFSFVSDMRAKVFRAPLDNEFDPKQLAQQCAEILKKHLDPAEQEIVTLLNEHGYENK